MSARHQFTPAARQARSGLSIDEFAQAVSYEAQREQQRIAHEAHLADRAQAEAEATRVARCSCGREEPSTPYLAFRETAERHAEGRCAVCGYAEVAHSPETLKTWRERGVVPKFAGHEFVQAEPRDFDTFYCGCRGWD